MTSLFRGYLLNNPPKESEVYELKIGKTNSIPFSNIKPHQIPTLLKVQEEGFYHKISDPPVFYGMNSRFNSARPFDCMFLKGVKAYMVIWFYVPRQPKVFYKIPVVNFKQMIDNSIRKSFTEEMLLQIPHEKLYIKNEK